MLPLLLLVGALTTGPVIDAQAGPVELIRVWNVMWEDAIDRNGNRTRVPVLHWATPEGPRQQVRYAAPPQLSLVASLDDKFRLAKLANDLDDLASILSDDFVETNQNGNSRNKTEMIDLFRTFKIASLETTRATIRVGDSGVTITGEQTEVNGSGTDRMLFTRVYVLEPANVWKLFASMQFRRP